MQRLESEVERLRRQLESGASAASSQAGEADAGAAVLSLKAELERALSVSAEEGARGAASGGLSDAHTWSGSARDERLCSASRGEAALGERRLSAQRSASEARATERGRPLADSDAVASTVCAGARCRETAEARLRAEVRSLRARETELLAKLTAAQLELKRRSAGERWEGASGGALLKNGSSVEGAEEPSSGEVESMASGNQQGSFREWIASVFAGCGGR